MFTHAFTAAALCFAALLAWPGSSAAQTVGLHLATWHLKQRPAPADGSAPPPPYQSATPGAYVRATWGGTAGVFRNSYGRTSFYAGYTAEAWDGRLALTVGAVSGYAPQAISPLLVPSVRLALGGALQGAAIRLAFIPKPPKLGHSAGAHLGLEFSL